MTHLLPAARTTRTPILALLAAVLLSALGAGVGPATAAAAPGAVFSTNVVDLGYVRVGTVAEQTFTLTNNGDATLQIYSQTMSTSTMALTVTGDSSGPLAAGGVRTFTVRYAPTQGENASAVLRLYSNAPGSPRTLQIAAVGARPVLSVNTGPYNPYFGTVPVGSTSTAALTINNSGNAPLTVTGATITGADASEFSVNTSSATAAPIQPYGSKTIYVTFAPGSTGAKTASLQINSDSVVPVNPIALNGTGS